MSAPDVFLTALLQIGATAIGALLGLKLGLWSYDVWHRRKARRISVVINAVDATEFDRQMAETLAELTAFRKKLEAQQRARRAL